MKSRLLTTAVFAALTLVCLARVASPRVQVQPAVSPKIRQCWMDNGLAYSPFRDGQSPEGLVPAYPTLDQIDEDLAFLGRMTKRIRTYGTAHSLGEIPRLAKQHGITVMQGVWLGKDLDANEVELKAAVQLAKEGLVESVVIGNEVFTGTLLSKAKLIDYIRQVRRQLPANIKIATAEVDSQWTEDTKDLIGEVDFVVAHFYPFWAARSIQGAVADVFLKYDSLQHNIKKWYPNKSIELVIGETGWPSAGTTRQGGVASEANQRQYLTEFLEVACGRKIRFYYFSAFDEEWKWSEGLSGQYGDARLPSGNRTFSGRWVGSSWGLFLANGLRKPALAASIAPEALEGRRVRDIFVDGRLSKYYDLGVDTSHGRRDWVAIANDFMKMEYPATQDWGSVFITVGKPTPPPRPWRDFSEFDTLYIELKGGRRGDAVEIGVKGYSDPGLGTEKRVTIRDLTTEFRPYRIGLDRFKSGVFVYPDSLSRLNVVVEFVFSGPKSSTIYAKNIRFLKTESSK